MERNDIISRGRYVCIIIIYGSRENQSQKINLPPGSDAYGLGHSIIVIRNYVSAR